MIPEVYGLKCRYFEPALNMRFGICSLIIAELDLFVGGFLIVSRLRIPDGWIDSVPADQLDRVAGLVLAGNVAIVLFPLFAAIGAGLAAIGIFRYGWREWLVDISLAANALLLMFWIGGLVWYILTFRFDYLYVK